jgi:hypothetical protein
MRKCNFIDPWHPRFKIFKDIPVCSDNIGEIQQCFNLVIVYIITMKLILKQ